ncbi:LysR family transcriptional regulator [Lysobacter sp. S4-A87]|nr:LysR family transcriptional regulator [Lysobacter sp. S4-A87]UNK51185.1 LysR family transcriptional regulator [Lysobacter sp. S4-A87]
MPVPSPQSTTTRAEPLAACFSTSCAGVIAFVSVASEGSFARAADRLGIGRSAVSRSVQKLEEQLGARLLRRTTRSVSLTGEGEVFYEACRPGVERIVAAMEGVRDLRDGPPRGQLKVRATQGFGRQVIAPLLSEFRARFPELSVELLLDEGVVDFAADRIDVAFCDGPLQDSQVIARQLVPVRMQVCASADYARRHGLPASVDELARHACINLRLPNGRLQAWQFQTDGHTRSLSPNARIVFNDTALVLQSVLDGHGLAQLAACQVRDAVRSGELVTCLADIAPDDRSHYICYPSRKQLPNRIRAFVDFMTSRIREPC